MRKHLARILLLALIMIQALPMLAFAEEEQTAALTVSKGQEPYEKVVAQSGKWYSGADPSRGKIKIGSSISGRIQGRLIQSFEGVPTWRKNYSKRNLSALYRCSGRAGNRTS